MTKMYENDMVGQAIQYFLKILTLRVSIEQIIIHHH